MSAGVSAGVTQRVPDGVQEVGLRPGPVRSSCEVWVLEPFQCIQRARVEGSSWIQGRRTAGARNQLQLQSGRQAEEITGRENLPVV